jgi:hypothetical protein
MPWTRELLILMFGRPKGILGRLGGVIMARVNRDAAAQIIELLDMRPGDKVLEIGFGFTVNSGQPKEGVTELLAAAGFVQARIVDGSKLFCAVATRP